MSIILPYNSTSNNNIILKNLMLSYLKKVREKDCGLDYDVNGLFKIDFFLNHKNVTFYRGNTSVKFEAAYLAIMFDVFEFSFERGGGRRGRLLIL